MKRYILALGLGSLGLLGLFGVVYLLLDSTPVTVRRMARGKALFETENYLGALQMLRNIPADSSAAERHAYLGAAYLHLHLYQAALEEFQSASRQSPRTLDPWIGLAAVYLRLGDGRKALEGAGKAIEVAEHSIDAWLVLARAHWIQRSFGAAEQAAMKVHAIDPANRQATELLLRIYFEQGETQKFQSLLNATPAPDRPIQALAVQFAVRRGEFRHAYDLKVGFERRDLEAAILRSQLALKREPGRTDLHPALVRNLIMVGRPEEAIAAARAYTGELPLDFEMGKANWLIGNRQAAIHAYTRASAGRIHKLSAEVALAAITGDPRHWIESFRAERIEMDHFILARLEDAIAEASPLEKAFAYRYAGLFDSDFFNKAARQALAVLDTEPGSFDALMTISTAYSRLGRLEDATRYIELAKQLHPHRAEVWARLSEMALRTRDPEKAGQSMQNALRLEPSNPSYLYNFGWLLDQLDRDAEAVPLYERAITASDLSFEAMNNLALLEGTAGRHERAVKLLNRAVAANPENEAAYLNRANYHVSQKSWRDATRDYRRAQEINPASVFAAVELGRLQLELGNADKALDELNRALEIDANAYDAYVLMASAYEKISRSHEANAARIEAKRIRPEAPPEGNSK